MSVFSDYFLLRAWHMTYLSQNGNREVAWIESRSANHLMYADLYEINHLSFGFSAKENRRARSGYSWKLQALGEARDSVADAVGNVSCLQTAGLWNTAIQLHQHLTASQGRQPHGKFLTFACYSASSWDLCGMGRLTSYRAWSNFLSLDFPHLLNRCMNIGLNFFTRILTY